MANATINKVTCPTCGEHVNVQVNVSGGYGGSYFNPPEPPEVSEIEVIEFGSCDHDLPHRGENDVEYEKALRGESEHPFWVKVNQMIDDGEIDWNDPDPPEPEPNEWLGYDWL